MRLLILLILLPTITFAESEMLPEVTVTAESSTVSVSSRIKTSMLDSSRSISVLDGPMLENKVNLSDAIRNLSNVNIDPSSVDGNRSNYMLRGFTIDDDWGTKVDGQTNLEWADFELFNVERIEVSKGPNAAVSGLSDPGGFVNLVTKKANWTKQLEVQQSVGTYGIKSSISFSTPINDSLASRTVISYTDGQAPQLNGNTEKERAFLGQNFVFKTDHSKLEFNVRHLYDFQNYGMSSFLPAVGNGPAPIDLHTNMSSPSDAYRVNDDQVGYRFDMDLNKDLAFHHDFKFQTIDRTRKFLNPTSLDGNILTTSYYWLQTTKSYKSTDNYLTFKQPLFGLPNNLVTGFTFVASDTHTSNLSTRAMLTDTCGTTNALYCINILNPNFQNFRFMTGQSASSLGSQQGLSGVRDDATGAGTFNQNTFGFYGQDALHLTKQLILNTGLRYDISSQSGTNVTSATNYALNPNVGLVYKFTDDFSIYTDYAKGFMPQSQVSLSYIPPQYSEQKEVGIKYQSDVAYLNIAAYDLTRTNALTTDPHNAALYTYAGEVNNKGLEADGSYRYNSFTLSGNWALVDSKVTKDLDSSLIGNRFPSVAANQYGVWLNWDSKLEEYKVGLGLGFKHIGKRAGDVANSFELPAYTTLDASSYVERDKIRLSLMLKNITDERYYIGSSNRFNIMQGLPFTVMSTIDIRF